jgi:hypothetical protein
MSKAIKIRDETVKLLQRYKTPQVTWDEIISKILVEYEKMKGSNNEVLEYTHQLDTERKIDVEKKEMDLEKQKEEEKRMEELIRKSNEIYEKFKNKRV